MRTRMQQVTRIAAGAEHSAAVTADGSLYTWGGGGGGKLGHGSAADELSPRRVGGVLVGLSLLPLLVQKYKY